jgi:hypothetical protein
LKNRYLEFVQQHNDAEGSGVESSQTEKIQVDRNPIRICTCTPAGLQVAAFHIVSCDLRVEALALVGN